MPTRMAKINFNELTSVEIFALFYPYLGDDCEDRNYYDKYGDPIKIKDGAPPTAHEAFEFWQKKCKEELEKGYIED